MSPIKNTAAALFLLIVTASCDATKVTPSGGGTDGKESSSASSAIPSPAVDKNAATTVTSKSGTESGAKSSANSESIVAARPDGKAESLLRQMSDFYKHLNSFETVCENEAHVEFRKTKNTMKGKASVAFERPNLLALKGDEGRMGLTVVSDGKTMYTSFAAVKRYTKREAPKSLEQLATDPMLGASPGSPTSFILMLASDDPYKLMMDGVTGSKDLGMATLGGKPAHHLQFNQPKIDWDIWIAEGKQPLLLQVSTDMSRMMMQGANASAGAGAGAAKPKMTMLQRFRDWKVDVKPKPDVFTFAPPKGYKETKNLFARQDEEEEEELSPLVGKPAPPVDLEQLDGKRFRLSDHVGKDVVMLDMWATWCGPCRVEMPVLAEMAKEYQAKGVALCALNQAEPKAHVQDFLKKEKLDIPVALDKDGNVGDSYGAESIPLLAIIDKKGVVQSIHIGYAPTIKTTLRKELDELLAGKDIAAEAIAQRAKRPRPKLEGLEIAWKASGGYTSAVYDPHSKTLFALKRGACDVLGPDGKTRRSFKVTAQGTTLRLARLGDRERSDLLVFGTWGRSVTALSTTDGAELWRQTNSSGVDDVWAADIDGDGRDEVIIGYNGDGGLHVLNHDGVLRWKTTAIGNVWHVTAGDVNGDKKMEVLSTSAEGSIHTFDAQGKSPTTLTAPFYAHGVRAIRLSKTDAADTILVTGTAEQGESMAALDGKGHAKWTLEFPDGPSHVDAMSACPNRPWAACGMRGGRVLIVDCEKGKVIATAEKKARMLDVAWEGEENDQAPLLFVSHGHDLTALRVTLSATPKTAAKK